MNMYLNKTLSGSFEPAVLSLLRSKQCPMRVYREIWKYIPHSDKPKIVNLKDQILEHIMCPHPNPRVASLMKHVGGPTKLIETMRKFSNDNEYLRRLIQNRTKTTPEPRTLSPITMGPYLKLRAKLRNMGMMWDFNQSYIEFSPEHRKKFKKSLKRIPSSQKPSTPINLPIFPPSLRSPSFL